VAAVFGCWECRHRRDFVIAAFAFLVLDVGERLGFCLAEVFAAALVFDQQYAAPEQVNLVLLAGERFDGRREGCDRAAADAEHSEELVPEGFCMRVFAQSRAKRMAF